MPPISILVRIPATTANLGPGFDALGLALDLWNETRFVLEGEGIRWQVRGEGATELPLGEENLILQAMRLVYRVCERPFPPGVRLEAHNRIPLGAGLGSSAAAILTGLLGANALLGTPLTLPQLLNLATQMEGHPDNVAPALLGGLTVALSTTEGTLAWPLPWRPFRVTVVVPQFVLPTAEARRVLPKRVSLRQAADGMARAILVTRAFASGDIELLRRAMEDGLHQPYRLPLIPGAEQALTAARERGAAVALSGAGPSLVAFSRQPDPELAWVMQQAFAAAGLPARVLNLGIARHGAQVITGQ